MKIKVETNGTPHGTIITDTETGKRLDDVLALSFSLSGRQAGLATIVIERLVTPDQPLVVEGPATQVWKCGEHELVVHPDGTTEVRGCR